MNFIKALEIIKKNKHLIGSDYKGATIDELVILPTDMELRQQVIQNYLMTHNAQQAIAPYTNYDVEIFCVFDKGRINANGFFLNTHISKLSDKLDVDIE
ncbi:hypothetical protein [Flavobacterium filum]|uniref:hypothetical protein n=1 Tax=Flavobacterium filum TaxID=370974 RepID=UPI00040EB884|nr:hypothetical protein [Flavobacterium filum]